MLSVRKRGESPTSREASFCPGCNSVCTAERSQSGGWAGKKGRRCCKGYFGRKSEKEGGALRCKQNNNGNAAIPITPNKVFSLQAWETGEGWFISGVYGECVWEEDGAHRGAGTGGGADDLTWQLCQTTVPGEHCQPHVRGRPPIS